ncbi:glycosyltransferase family 2 protein [Sphingomonas paeninsulae]|jgi:glycosyltransferase involved in cell wall biosynthesis|uniref:Glycosyltransferase family 2 protein n=1 Tax=Sphingomonas paeninsulae TaxID=2319844 RepID=A0A494T939_SPHPE|nr:glycosyltransferase family A protein [Sphingomonas paeninsulae]AYJ85869.1 glycosyltransferase family 2 protein [Sphingomonas paeninsulae]
MSETQPARLSVSVVIPCHNYGRYLPDALASVLDQSRAVDQIVLVDDGSTDGSADIAREIAPDIIIFPQAQGGIARARNSGLAAATGDLIAFLDADDIWPVDSLASRIAPIEADPAVAGSFGLVEQFLCPMMDAEARERLHCPSGQVAARLMGALLVRRSVAEQIGAFDSSLAIGETMDWISRLTALGSRLTTVDTLVLRRRIHGSNTVLAQTDYADYFTVMRAAIRRRTAAGNPN